VDAGEIQVELSSTLIRILMRRILTVACHALAWFALSSGGNAALAQTPAPSQGVQFIFTADAHYGISRSAFRGGRNVASHDVNAALVAEINRLDGLAIPDDGGVGAGRLVGAIDFVVEGGDIANRAEKGVQSAAASWREFERDYIDGLTTRDRSGRKSALFIVPGNHDASNAIGFRVPLSPARDATAMTAIYNLMLVPVPLRTIATYNYERDRIHYARDVGRVHLAFLHIWPDSAERAWLERDLDRVPPGTPVLLFTHDPPIGDPKHFINPNTDHAIDDTGRFENLLSETLKDRSPGGTSTEIEQRAFARFVKAHANIRAYFHGHSNFSEMYVWRGPGGDIALPVFRADSPMKGKLSVADETKLSFQFVAIDGEAKRMTVRELFWNATPGTPESPPEWGAMMTVALR
jgi:hypothetical protein